MTALPAALQSHLDTGATTTAWAWRVTRTDGTVFGFCNCDVDLTFDGTTFQADSGFDAAELQEGSDLSVDAQEAHGVLRSGDITESDIVAGLWDNAAVEIWLVNTADTDQRYLKRKGVLGDIRRGARVDFTAEVRSLAHLLAQPLGRTFQATCDAVLGDARCGVDLTNAAFKGSGTVSATNRAREFVASGLSAFADAWFTKGRVTWATGANAGRVMQVERHVLDGTDAIMTLLEAPTDAIAASDTFTVTAGCDKLHPTCDTKFSNIVNFRGFPHIPGQATVLRYAGNSGGKTGSTL